MPRRNLAAVRVLLGCGDRFRVTLFAIMLKAELEVILRSLRRRLIDRLSIRSREKFARS